MADHTLPGLPAIRNLVAGDADLLRGLVEQTVNALMSEQADALCGAGWGERSPERPNQRNGYRERRWDTRAGTIDLKLPKLREGLARVPARPRRARPVRRAARHLRRPPRPRRHRSAQR